MTTEGGQEFPLLYCLCVDDAKLNARISEAEIGLARREDDTWTDVTEDVFIV